MIDAVLQHHNAIRLPSYSPYALMLTSIKSRKVRCGALPYRGRQVDLRRDGRDDGFLFSTATKDAVVNIKAFTKDNAKAISALAGLTLILLGRYLFTWPTPLIYPTSSLGTDLPREIWPLIYFVKKSLLSTGELPLWRPYLLSGTPLVGHPIAPLFYPPHWLTIIFPIALGLNLDIVLHIFWMGLGTYLYASLEAGMRWQAAFISALIFSMSPMWLAHISGGHIPMLAAIAWWPWIWLSWNRYLSTTKARWILLAGIGLAAQIMNHGMFFALSLLALSVHSITQLFQHRSKVVLRLMKGWAISITVAFLLSAVQLLPFLQLLPISTRFTLSAQESQFGSLPIALILNALLPPTLKFPEWYLYPGVGALALTLSGIGLRWVRRERYAGIALLGSLIMALGVHTPLFAMFQTIIPGFSILRVPARWWVFALFAFALLSGWAFESWFTSKSVPGGRYKLLLYGAGFLYGLIAALSLIPGLSLPYDVFPAAILMILIISTLLSGPPSRVKAVIIPALIFFDLYWTGNILVQPQSPTELQEPTAVTRLLQSAAQSEERSLAPYGGVDMSKLAAAELRASDGYDSFALRDYTRVITFASGCDYRGYSAAVPPMAANPDAAATCPTFSPYPQLLALFNIRYILLPDRSLYPGATPDLYEDDLYVYQQSEGFERVFGLGSGVKISPDECPQILLEHDLSTTALVETDLPFVQGSEPHRVTQELTSNNSETFRVVADDPGLLIRSESWAPGWRVFIDGEEALVYRVDCALQGVWVEPGVHQVTFRYQPKSYNAGRLISMTTIVLLILYLWASPRITSTDRRKDDLHASQR
jgi:hypothetical protein